MLDHIGFGVTDFKRSKAFYSQALAPLGYKLVMQVSLSEDGEDGYAGFVFVLDPDGHNIEAVNHLPE